MQFQCNDTALKITTVFGDGIHIFHAFHLKFTINANLLYRSLLETYKLSSNTYKSDNLYDNSASSQNLNGSSRYWASTSHVRPTSFTTAIITTCILTSQSLLETYKLSPNTYKKYNGLRAVAARQADGRSRPTGDYRRMLIMGRQWTTIRRHTDRTNGQCWSLGKNSDYWRPEIKTGFSMSYKFWLFFVGIFEARVGGILTFWI